MRRIRSVTRIAAALMVGAALAIEPSPAVAHPHSGHVYDHGNVQDMLDSVAAQKVFYDYGLCVAKARRRSVEAHLAKYPLAMPRKETEKLATDECLMEGDLSFDPEALRGPLYQGLYRLDFRYGHPDLSKVPQLDYTGGADAVGTAAEIHVNLRKFADCAVRLDQAAARSLVMSEVGSGGEDSSYRRLAPVMGGCVVPGHKISLKRPLVRALIAETLYRLSAAAAGQAMREAAE